MISLKVNILSENFILSFSDNYSPWRTSLFKRGYRACPEFISGVSSKIVYNIFSYQF